MNYSDFLWGISIGLTVAQFCNSLTGLALIILTSGASILLHVRKSGKDEQGCGSRHV